MNVNALIGAWSLDSCQLIDSSGAVDRESPEDVLTSIRMRPGESSRRMPRRHRRVFVDGHYPLGLLR
jgi:hypothetical protein